MLVLDGTEHKRCDLLLSGKVIACTVTWAAVAACTQARLLPLFESAWPSVLIPFVIFLIISLLEIYHFDSIYGANNIIQYWNTRQDYHITFVFSSLESLSVGLVLCSTFIEFALAVDGIPTWAVWIVTVLLFVRVALLLELYVIAPIFVHVARCIEVLSHRDPNSNAKPSLICKPFCF